MMPAPSSGPSASHNSKRTLGLTLLMIAVVALPWVLSWGGASWLRILNFALLYVMLSLGLNIVVGFAGLLDLGYIAFYALGAYLYALLASPHLTEQFPAIAALFPSGLHIPILAALVIAALVAGIFGALLGAPTLKLRGDYLAIVTLGFGEIIRIFMNNLNAPYNITNGPQGINMVDPVRLAGIDFAKGWVVGPVTLTSTHLYYYLFALLVILIVLVSFRLQNSRLGRAWMAIREDEIAAKAMGINTRNVKLMAFAMGASFGGIAGALFAASQGFVSPESFGLMESLVILSMVVLGGMGHIPGVILGALLLSGFPELLRAVVIPLQQSLFGKVLMDAEIIRSLIYGVAMVAVMRFKPAGLWPTPKREAAQ